MTNFDRIKPKEYDAADERLSPMRNAISKRLADPDAPQYRVEFLHTSDTDVTAHLIHGESNVSVGYLAWNHQTGNSVMDVNSHHRNNGVNSARLISESWKYAKAANIGGPSDSGVLNVAGWQVLKNKNPKAPRFLSHPFSVPEGGTPRRSFGSASENEIRERKIKPEFKGARVSPPTLSEEPSDGDSANIKRRWSSDVVLSRVKKSRDDLLQELTKNNFSLQNEEQRLGAGSYADQNVSQDNAASSVFAPKQDCEMCGGRGQTSIVGWGLGRRDVENQLERGDDDHWHWHHPDGREIGYMSGDGVRGLVGDHYELDTVRDNGDVIDDGDDGTYYDEGRSGTRITFRCPECRTGVS
jgi:hypothetical protein